MALRLIVFHISLKLCRVLDASNWVKEAYTYDVICCLNVLDRCDCPLTMLRQMHRKLAPGGLLLLAVVMPVEPFVENGTSHQHMLRVLHICYTTLSTVLTTFTMTLCVYLNGKYWYP